VNREQLAHILRSSAQLAEDENIIVIGSQAILGTYRDEILPREAVISMEADIAFRDDPTDEKADRVDGAIGEGSSFDAQYRYYAQGVSVTTATLPRGWEARLVPFERADAHPSKAFCLDPNDLVVSKLVAGRPKDIAFATALLGAGLIDADRLRDRADLLETPGAVRRRVQSAIERCARRARGRP
jgi:hypothetical protein